MSEKMNSNSEQANMIAYARKCYDKLPEVREDKIKDIKERMENGTYNVTSQEVAEKILSYNKL